MNGRILVLSPHTDDGELGCGGTIARLIEEGKEIFYVALSAAEKSVPKGMPKDILRKEVMKATKVLGIPSSNVFVLKFEVREFPKYRQEILDTLINFRKELSPDVVFMPSLRDLHQDHQVTANEALRAFKKYASTILGYELPWNHINFDATGFVALEKRHIDKKVKSLSMYESQKHHEYMNPEFIYGLAKARGVVIGAKFAEAFQVIRWVKR